MLWCYGGWFGAFLFGGRAVRGGVYVGEWSCTGTIDLCSVTVHSSP